MADVTGLGPSAPHTLGLVRVALVGSVQVILLVLVGTAGFVVSLLGLVIPASAANPLTPNRRISRLSQQRRSSSAAPSFASSSASSSSLTESASSSVWLSEGSRPESATLVSPATDQDENDDDGDGSASEAVSMLDLQHGAATTAIPASRAELKLLRQNTTASHHSGSSSSSSSSSSASSSGHARTSLDAAIRAALHLPLKTPASARAGEGSAKPARRCSVSQRLREAATKKGDKHHDCTASKEEKKLAFPGVDPQLTAGERARFPSSSRPSRRFSQRLSLIPASLSPSSVSASASCSTMPTSLSAPSPIGDAAPTAESSLPFLPRSGSSSRRAISESCTDHPANPNLSAPTSPRPIMAKAGAGASAFAGLFARGDARQKRPPPLKHAPGRPAPRRAVSECVPSLSRGSASASPVLLVPGAVGDAKDGKRSGGNSSNGIQYGAYDRHRTMSLIRAGAGRTAHGSSATAYTHEQAFTSDNRVEAHERAMSPTEMRTSSWHTKARSAAH